jgi:hypothetical protein
VPDFSSRFASERAVSPTVPGWFPDDLCHFTQDLTAKRAHLGKTDAFGVSQSWRPLKLAAENAVLIKALLQKAKILVNPEWKHFVSKSLYRSL